MIVSITHENLVQALQKVSRSVSGRSTLPIVQNVLMVCENGTLRLTTTNLEFSITTWVSALIEREGSITVPFRVFNDSVRAFPSDVVTLETLNTEGESAADGRTLLAKCGPRSSARFACVPAKDFPTIPTVEDGTGASLDPKVLKQGIGMVTFSAAQDEARPVLTGMNLKMEEHDILMACADGFRLAVYGCKLENPIAEKVNVIIPAKAADEVTRLCDGQSQMVEMMLSTNSNQVMFKTGDAELVSNLLVGTFPNFEQLIPEENTLQMTAKLDIQEYKRAAQSAAIFARDGSNILRMEFEINEESQTPHELKVSARSEEVGEAETIMGVEELEGDPGKIAFNVKYVQDIVSILEGQAFSFSMVNSSSPGVFRPAGGIDYTHVVMPMYVQW